MMMSSSLQRAFISTYFKGLIPEEHAEYLRRHYGDAGEGWSLQPPMLSVWFQEDLDQFREETFDNDENEERRKIRVRLLVLAEEADEMYRDGDLEADEVRAVYDMLFWIYLSRTRTSEAAGFRFD